jgi:hypothetical protein
VACFEVSAQGGGATWYRSGVGGWCGKSLCIDLHTEMGWRKIAEATASRASALLAPFSLICWEDHGSWLA